MPWSLPLSCSCMSAFEALQQARGSTLENLLTSTDPDLGRWFAKLTNYVPVCEAFTGERAARWYVTLCGSYSNASCACTRVLMEPQIERLGNCTTSTSKSLHYQRLPAIVNQNAKRALCQTGLVSSLSWYLSEAKPPESASCNSPLLVLMRRRYLIPLRSDPNAARNRSDPTQNRKLVCLQPRNRDQSSAWPLFQPQGTSSVTHAQILSAAMASDRYRSSVVRVSNTCTRCSGLRTTLPSTVLRSSQCKRSGVGGRSKTLFSFTGKCSTQPPCAMPSAPKRVQCRH